jgi:hypothetical protein
MSAFSYVAHEFTRDSLPSKRAGGMSGFVVRGKADRSGQKALVTGANSGIGKAVASAMAEAGVVVAVD